MKMTSCENNSYFIFVESNTSGTGYEFIRRANKKGYRTVLISNNASRYDLVGISTEIFIADTNNMESVLKICRELRNKAPIAGIMSTSEYYVKIAAEIAEAFQLPGPSPKAVEACRDKSIQRSAMIECGLACPNNTIISCPEDYTCISFDYPVVIKPIRGSGSVDVRLCSDAIQLQDAVNEYFNGNHKNDRSTDCGNELLVEEYIHGHEYSAEVFGCRILGFTAKHLGALPYFVETGHDFAVTLPESIKNKAEKAILTLCEHMGLDFGAKHVEFRIRNDEIYIIEVNPRLAGGHIPTVMEYAFSGEKLMDQIIDVYAGLRSDIALGSITSPVSIRFIIPPHDGIFYKAAIRDGIEKNDILEMKTYRQPGTHVSLHGDFRDRIGHIIYKTNSLPDKINVEEIIDLTIE